MDGQWSVRANALIQLKNALKGANCVAIIGLPGVGKSTLVRALNPATWLDAAMLTRDDAAELLS